LFKFSHQKTVATAGGKHKPHLDMSGGLEVNRDLDQFWIEFGLIEDIRIQVVVQP
jgi:hypothetical protein